MTALAILGAGVVGGVVGGATSLLLQRYLAKRATEALMERMSKPLADGIGGLVDALEGRAKGKPSEPDPYADERPTSNGEVSVHLDGHKIADASAQSNGNGRVVVEEDAAPGPAASGVQEAVAILREHVGHDISVVQDSGGARGVLICTTCGTNTPLHNRTMITTVESGVSDADL